MSDVAADWEEEVHTFLSRLTALREAGDTAAAIRLIDEPFATRRPDDPVLAATGDALFQTVASQPSLSARLFCHLVMRFDWRDARGRAAEADPQRHSIILARVAAEDWYQALLTQAAQPGQLVAACAVARGAMLPLPQAGLDEHQKDEARALMDALGQHGDFLLERFDARSLAGLREAVEGPPLVTAPRKPAWLSKPPVRKALDILVVAIAALVLIVFLFRDDLFKSASPPVHNASPEQVSPTAQARQNLDETMSHWLEITHTVPLNFTTVNFNQLLLCSAAIREIRYGLDRAKPDQVFPLPAQATTYPAPIGIDTKIAVEGPAALQFVSLQLVYADGSTSPVEVYRTEVK
jgi:hypothetical protein